VINPDIEKDHALYRAGDLKAFEPSQPSEAFAQEVMLQFDGWLEHLKRWQVESILDDIARAYDKAQEP
jgi:hypothetical protein